MKMIIKIPAEVKELRTTATLKEPSEASPRFALNLRCQKEQGVPEMRLPAAIAAF